MSLPNHVFEKLPKNLRLFLERGPSDVRHDFWQSGTLQLKGAQKAIPELTDQAIFDYMRERVPDTDKSSNELWRLIRGADKRNPQPVRRYSREQLPSIKVKKFKATGERKQLPTDLAKYTPIDYLNATFEPNELVCITWPNKYGDPTEDDIHTVSEWADIYKGDPDYFSHKDGVYYMVNPAKTDNGGHEKENLADLRNCLVELEVPKKDRKDLDEQARKAKGEEFYAAALASGLPIRAIYSSGGPSIHVVVAIDASALEEYNERVKHVYDYCATMPGFDKANKNASRLSRLPGAMRDGKKQTLLCLATGATSYDEWLDSAEERLLTIENPAEWTAEQVELPPVLVDGWLYQGHIGMLTGSVKTNKSWTLLEIAIALATDGEWLGRKCHKSAVLYIDAEIQRPFWKLRAMGLCDARDLDYDEVIASKNIRPCFVAGKTPDADQLQRELLRLFERGALDDVSLIVIDPIYQFYKEEWDENGNSDIGKLGRILRAIAEATGKSILFAHHHTKGNQDGKRDIEKASGGGSFGRFVASSLAITLINEDTHQYTLGWTTTNFPPSPKQVAYRESFHWRITDEDPKEAARNRRSINEVVDCLPDDGATSDAWKEFCRAKFTITDQAFKDLRSAAKKARRVHYSKVNGDTWAPTASELERRQASLVTQESTEDV